LLEGAFLRFKIEVMFFQDVKDNMDVFLMALPMFFLSFSRTSLRMNGEIIHVY